MVNIIEINKLKMKQKQIKKNRDANDPDFKAADHYGFLSDSVEGEHDHSEEEFDDRLAKE